MEHEQLPVSVSGPVEVGRLLHELEKIDNILLEQSLRNDGHSVEMPQTSRLMEQIFNLNQLNLLHKEDRERLSHFLRQLKDQAPVLHISFSADPPPDFMDKLVTWLRREINPRVLVTTGVQPTIAAGCVVRSTNKYFDFSLRQAFVNKRDALLRQLEARPTMEAEPHE